MESSEAPVKKIRKAIKEEPGKIKKISQAITPPKKANGGGAPTKPVTAEDLAKRQREISVSEFFTKNRHLLGFDNPTRALLTAVKEAVDNSLDACEEAGILPELLVKINQKAEDRFHVTVDDNGPGIVEAQIGNIFGKLLYGSKFHSHKQARGQQGIGISAVCLYGQLTTGKSMRITSKTGPDKQPHCFEVMIDSARNTPLCTKKTDGIKFSHDHGTRVEFEIEGRYIKGDKSVDEYIKQTVLANPHAKFVYDAPGTDGRISFPRVSKTLPEQPREVLPHPYGVELGTLIKILQSSKSRDLKGCLKKEFSRVSDRVADEILKTSGLEGAMKPPEMTPEQFDKLFRAINKTKIMSPPTDCISPIGEEQLLKTLNTHVKAEFYTTITRPPAVYRGNPFQIEIAIAYGVEGHPPDDHAIVHRYANRVPLLYQPGACALTKAVTEVDWKNYGISQPKDGMPQGPMLVIVHMASVWVPFTSEAKEAVAHYPEILKEVKLGLQEAGRRASIHVRQKARIAHQLKRRSIFERYIEELSSSLDELTRCGKEKVKSKLLKLAKSFTSQMEKEDEELVNGGATSPAAAARAAKPAKSEGEEETQ
ncbi:MAG TPA: DNA topoisomerase VI subunit B [Planctomycetota bacterium]|nr:DNA topoisomerase VI subunit B [Planctomycetota bacterium]